MKSSKGMINVKGKPTPTDISTTGNKRIPTVPGPGTFIQATKTGSGGQKGKAKGGAVMAKNAGPGKNAKSFGQGKATDNRSAKKGN